MSVEASIRARVEQYVEAFNRGDAEGCGAIYAEEGSHTYAMGFTDYGRENVTAHLAELFAGPWQGLQLRLEVKRVIGITPDVAVEHEEWEVSGLADPAGNQLPPLSGLTLITWVLKEGAWFVAAGQAMMPIQPPG